MRGGDSADDRETEAGPPATVAPTAHEALEDPLPELGRDPRSVVLDDHRRVPVLDGRPRAHVCPRRRMPKGVLQQVEREAVQVIPDSGDDRRIGLDRELVIVRERAEFAGGLHQDVAEIGRAVRLIALGVGSGEEQQVADEAAHPPRGAQRGLGGIGLVALELLGEQLEVGEDARQRRAQLVRGVGDEFALSVEHRLRVRARGVKRTEHPLQRARQLRDLVVGLGVGDAPARVTRALDLAGGFAQLDDRADGPLRRCKPSQQREHRAAEHAEQQEEAHTREGVLDVGDRPGVDQRQVAVRLRRHRSYGDEIAVLGVLTVGLLRRVDQQVGGRRRLGALDPHLVLRAQHLSLIEDPDLRVLGTGEAAEADLGVLAVGFQADEPDLVIEARLELVSGGRDLVVELATDLPGRQHADDRRETGEDHERQCRRAAGKSPADRNRPIRGERSPRRGSYVGAEARHPIPASSVGWTRTPRSCSSSRTGHIPTPRRAGAGAR